MTISVDIYGRCRIVSGMYLANMTPAQILAQCRQHWGNDLNQYDINRLLNKAHSIGLIQRTYEKLPVAPKPAKLSVVNRGKAVANADAIMEAHRMGESVRGIARRFGVSHVAVHNVVRAFERHDSLAKWLRTAAYNLQTLPEAVRSALDLVSAAYPLSSICTIKQPVRNGLKAGTKPGFAGTELPLDYAGTPAGTEPERMAQ